MSAFLYGLLLQFKLDIRSRTLLITCYVVPLLFFAIMGGIFSAVTPDAKQTLIQAMTIMGVTMGAVIGVPQSVAEIYGSDIKKVYMANGVPLCLGLVTVFLSSLLHLFIMSGIICAVAPVAFGAALPANLPLYFASLTIFIAVSLSVGCVLGLAFKAQAKLVMVAQIVFLPSIMLSGIMFPVGLLPAFLSVLGKLFPAGWGFRLMSDIGSYGMNLWPLLVVLIVAVALCTVLLKRSRPK